MMGGWSFAPCLFIACRGREGAGCERAWLPGRSRLVGRGRRASQPRRRSQSTCTDVVAHRRVRQILRAMLVFEWGPVHTGTTGPGVSAGEANSGCHGHREAACEIRSVLYGIVSIDDAGQHARTGGTVAVCALGELWRRG
jgi:hypothetical protein